MGTSQKAFNYLGLPAEIRIMIMEYVLVPGDLYPQHHSPHPPTTDASATECGTSPVVGAHGELVKASGPLDFQLLAVCKQIHAEGGRLFYEKNTFHLPPGPIENTLERLDKLRPEHRDMIKSVSITVTPCDISPSVLAAINQWREGAEPGELSDYHVLSYLKSHLWEKKVEFLREWKSLDVIYMRNVFTSFTVELGRMKKRSRNRVVARSFRRLVKDMFGVLHGTIEVRGWEALSLQLMEHGRFGSCNCCYALDQ